MLPANAIGIPSQNTVDEPRPNMLPPTIVPSSDGFDIPPLSAKTEVLPVIECKQEAKVFVVVIPTIL